MNSNKYNKPSEINKEQFLDVVNEGIISSTCQAIVDAVYYIEDYDWVLEQFKHLLNHKDVQVRGVVVSCVGHLARTNERADKKQLLAILQPLLSHQDIIGRVEDAMEDIEIFLDDA